MKNTLYIFILYLIIGCETIIEIDIPSDPPSFVINSTLSKNEFIRVNVSQSQHILESGDYKLIEGATVEIYENGKLLTVLSDSSEGNYISAEYKPQIGNAYSIEVSKNGFETARSEVLLPLDSVKILSVAVDTLVENNYGYKYYYLRFSIEIDDDIAFDNYYDISIYQGSYQYNYDYSFDPPLILDSTYYYYKEYIESRDPSLEEFQSYGQNILFNDALFNGNIYHMNMLVSIWIDDENPNPKNNEWDYFISLGNTSESYYLYEISSQLQYWTGDNPFAQPVTVYNNIENGFGVFGAYNTSVYKVDY